jgi:hypothetical protein
MADNNTARFGKLAQDMTRSMQEAMQEMAETQFNILQKTASIKADQFNQAVALNNDQLQLMSTVQDPREFAYAQAELIKEHGQRYVDSVKEGVDAMVEAWQQYGKRLESGAGEVAGKTKQAASSKKS